MSRAAVITGLAAESERLVVSLPPDEPALSAFISCAAANSARAGALAEHYLASGVKGLVSFGVCGGLDPALSHGQVFLPTEIVTNFGQSFKTDDVWRYSLIGLARDHDLAVTEGRLLGSDKAILSRAEKRAAFQEKAVQAVDMESHGIARVAAEAGIPFIAVRVVADSAERSVPALTEGLIDAKGRPKAALAALRLLAQPWFAPRMIGLKRDFSTALSALELAGLVFGESLFRVGAKT